MKWSDKFLTLEQAEALLNGVAENRDVFRYPERAHAAIFCGYNLGLRISEICLLKRRHFKTLHQGFVALPTLKRSQKIRFQCPGCHKRFNLAARRGGKNWPCPECLTVTELPATHADRHVPDVPIPFIEPDTAAYIESYVEGMRKDQEYLFERRPRVPCSRQDLWYDFRLAASLAGLPNVVPHAMRHGRGQRVWTTTHDINTVQACLRHMNPQTSMIYTHMEKAEEGLRELSKSSIRTNPLRRGE